MKGENVNFELNDLKDAIAFGGPTLVDVVCQPLQEARAQVSEWVA